jgi:transposase-like protein
MENDGIIGARKEQMKKVFSPKQKAEVALAAIKETQTIAQISSAFEVHPTQIGLWKKQAKEGLSEVFSDKRKKDSQNQNEKIDELYRIIGQRDAELVWLKKKLEPFSSS